MSFQIAKWRRAALQGTTILGVAMIALIWGATTIYLQSGRETDLRSATLETSNLARVFEQHIARTIRDADNTLITLRTIYRADRKSFALIDWPTEANHRNEFILHYSVIDATGKLVESTRKPIETFDFSTRDHFLFQKDATDEGLFVGRTIQGIRNVRPTIQLNRRITNPDGSFGGVVVASLDTEQLIKFYRAIDIGQQGSISLIGLDGYVRARRGSTSDSIEKLEPNQGVLGHIAKSPAGSYVSDGKFDGVVRLISYRRVADLPLVVVVGLSEREVLANYYSNRMRFYGLAGGITFLILIVMALSIKHHRNLNTAHDWLRKNEMFLRTSRQELKTTLESIDQGLLMADAKGNIGLINRRYIELLDLPPEWLTRKLTLPTLISFLTERGEFGKDGDLLDEHVRDIIIKDGGMSRTVKLYERTRPDGRVLEIRASALPDGGMVRTFTDVTERRRAEARIAELATHDDLTGLSNRSRFRERMNEAINNAERYGDSFALLMLDLDGFKQINDSMGHPAGDAVLKEISRRLLVCARNTDTVARLGGDEFALLQSKIRADQDAANFARRLIEAIGAPFDLDGKTIIPATSIGIAIALRDGADYEQLIKASDQALYRAKECGRNTFCFSKSDTIPARAGEIVELARAAS
jgi:diguanylate cyclase (GGDEF)-like protein